MTTIFKFYRENRAFRLFWIPTFRTKNYFGTRTNGKWYRDNNIDMMFSILLYYHEKASFGGFGIGWVCNYRTSPDSYTPPNKGILNSIMVVELMDGIWSGWFWNWVSLWIIVTHLPPNNDRSMDTNNNANEMIQYALEFVVIVECLLCRRMDCCCDTNMSDVGSELNSVFMECLVKTIPHTPLLDYNCCEEYNILHLHGNWNWITAFQF